MSTTPAPQPSPTLTDVAEDVSAVETQAKSDFSALSAGTKKLIQDALAAAKAEGSIIFGALHTAVATVTTKKS